MKGVITVYTHRTRTRNGDKFRRKLVERTIRKVDLVEEVSFQTVLDEAYGGESAEFPMQWAKDTKWRGFRGVASFQRKEIEIYGWSFTPEVMPFYWVGFVNHTIGSSYSLRSTASTHWFDGCDILEANKLSDPFHSHAGEILRKAYGVEFVLSLLKGVRGHLEASA